MSYSAEDIVRLLNLAINLLGVAIVPFVIYLLKSSASKRTAETKELFDRIVQAEQRAEDIARRFGEGAKESAIEINKRLDRIENGTMERMVRLESKIDTHLQWHLMTIRENLKP